jgi:uncharacterized protein YabN with tetrapyrrole methylase and pyrophosphatase domain
LGLQPEEALRKGCSTFASRFAAMEAKIRESGRELSALHPDALEEAWQEVKRR